MERRLRKQARSEIRYVSLYSGGGGLDAGLRAIGAECICAIERDPDSCETLRLNGHAEVIQIAIEDLPPAELRARFGGKLDRLDLIVGGPPCQPFSKSALWSNKAARGLADQRATTLTYFLDYVEAFRPRAFVLENVEGFVRWGGLAYLEQRLAEFAKRGIDYALSWRILDAASYGVPQHRRRFFAVGLSGKEAFEFPAPSYGSGRQPLLTAWDALSPIKSGVEVEVLEVRGRWANLLPSIPPGSNYLWHTDRGGGLPLFGWRTRFWSFLLKLGPDRPSPTLVASPSQNSGPFHWNNRLLSTKELAAIQTFPKDYHFAGARPSRQRQIGNAVPPLLAAVLGASVSKRLGQPASVPARLRIRRAAMPPEIPEVAAVPEEHHRMVGCHADHPGTGRGPRPRGGGDDTADLCELHSALHRGNVAAASQHPAGSGEMNASL